MANQFISPPGRFIVSLCGGSGSGKSTLAKYICESIGAERASRIPTDKYLKPNRYPSFEEFSSHPLEYDWELIERVLQEPDGKELAVPDFDFVNFRRISLLGSRSLVLRPIAILDAMLPYPKAHATILLEAPEQERRKRIIERDKRWKAQVIKSWKQHQLTLDVLRGLELAYDLVLDARLPVEQNAITVISLLDQRLGKIAESDQPGDPSEPIHHQCGKKGTS